METYLVYRQNSEPVEIKALLCDIVKLLDPNSDLIHSTINDFTLLHKVFYEGGYADNGIDSIDTIIIVSKNYICI